MSWIFFYDLYSIKYITNIYYVYVSKHLHICTAYTIDL